MNNNYDDELAGFGIYNQQEPEVDNRTIENIMFYSVQYDFLKAQYEHVLDFQDIFRKFIEMLEKKKETNKNEDRLMRGFEGYLKKCLEKSALSKISYSPVKAYEDNLPSQEAIEYWNELSENDMTIYRKNLLQLKRKTNIKIKVEEYALIIQALMLKSGFNEVNRAVEQLCLLGSSKKLTARNLKKRIMEIISM